MQSPVDLDSSKVVNNSLLTPMQYINYNVTPIDSQWNITNNGHTGTHKPDSFSHPGRGWVQENASDTPVCQK